LFDSEPLAVPSAGDLASRFNLPQVFVTARCQALAVDVFDDFAPSREFTLCFRQFMNAALTMTSGAAAAARAFMVCEACAR
jgi:hypothetical protein